MWYTIKDLFLNELIYQGLGKCSVLPAVKSSSCEYYVHVDGQSYTYALQSDVAINVSDGNTGCSDTWARHINDLEPAQTNKDNTIKIAEYLLDNGYCY